MVTHRWCQILLPRLPPVKKPQFGIVEGIYEENFCSNSLNMPSLGMFYMDGVCIISNVVLAQSNLTGERMIVSRDKAGTHVLYHPLTP